MAQMALTAFVQYDGCPAGAVAGAAAGLRTGTTAAFTFPRSLWHWANVMHRKQQEEEAAVADSAAKLFEILRALPAQVVGALGASAALGPPGVLALTLVAMCWVAGCPPGPKGPEIGRLPLIVSDDPEAEAEFREAKRLQDKGAVPEAAAQFEAFLKRWPEDPLIPVAQLALGRIRLAQNRVAEARELFRRVAAHADPAIAEQGRFYGGVAAHLQGSHREAIATLKPMQGRTIELEDTILLLRTLAAAHGAQGEFPEALEALDALSRERISQAERREAGAEIAAIAAHKASAGQIGRAYRKLPRDGPAWPAVARRALRVAERERDTDRMRQILQALQDEDIPLDEELKAMALRTATPVGANPQVVGAILSLSGRAREVGELALRGLMLAAGVPPAGPVPRDAPQLVFRDDGADPERAVQALDELVSVHRAVAVVGPIDGRAASAVAARAQALGVPLITLTPAGDIAALGPMVFRLFSTPESEARALVAEARRRKARRFALIYPLGAYGDVVREAFARQVSLQEGEVVASQTYEPRASSFGKEIAEMAKRSFDALFVAGTSDRVALIAPALAAADLWSTPEGEAPPTGGRAITVLVPNVGFSHQLASSVGRYLQGAVFSAPFDATTATDSARTFADQFQERFGAQPDVFAAFAHDAYRLIRAAVDRGAKTRKDVAHQLRTLRMPQTVGPSAGFSPAGEPLSGTRLLELQGESFVSLPTDRKATP